jgi:predicted nuclease of predicted toxin-antitoxin system
MRILFDQGTPAPLRHALSGHSVATAHEMGWSDLDNGTLLQKAESRFDLLITTDQNLQYQQNLAGRRLAVLVLPTTSWPKIRQHVAEVLATVESMPPGGYVELRW